MHTLEDVKSALVAAVQRYPKRRNPTLSGGDACVYTGRRGSHCIAGQILLDLGYEIPAWGDKWNEVGILALLNNDARGYTLMTDRPDRHNFNYELTREAVEFLTQAQTVFDGACTWSKGLKYLKEDGYLDSDEADAKSAG